MIISLCQMLQFSDNRMITLQRSEKFFHQRRHKKHLPAKFGFRFEANADSNETDGRQKNGFDF